MDKFMRRLAIESMNATVAFGRLALGALVAAALFRGSHGVLALALLACGASYASQFFGTLAVMRPAQPVFNAVAMAGNAMAVGFWLFALSSLN